ncbi:MAG: hypothetical protein P4L45_15085 [Ignavibacteriaceae bacterium]|nr:hypothetical protein [Ignavibacteriaceae bacterium]
MDKEILKRLESSLEFIKDGLTFKVGDFVLGKTKDGKIFVNSYLQDINIDKIEKSFAKEKLEEMTNEFNGLVTKSPRFQEFLSDFDLNYYLLYDTGLAGINICAVINGEFQFFL